MTDVSAARRPNAPAPAGDVGPGRIVVFSGPSGAGKTTVLRKVRKRCRQPLVLSVSATTRPPRPGESDGADYHFLSEGEFQARRRRGEFLECFEVFGAGHWYGTLRSEVAAAMRDGKWVVLEIDVRGALAIMDQHPEALTFFVHPGSLSELERRLRGRGTEPEAAIQRRLSRAREELTFVDRYRFQITNDQVDRAVTEICQILNHEAETPTYAR